MERVTPSHTDDWDVKAAPAGLLTFHQEVGLGQAFGLVVKRAVSRPESPITVPGLSSQPQPLIPVYC